MWVFANPSSSRRTWPSKEVRVSMYSRVVDIGRLHPYLSLLLCSYHLLDVQQTQEYLYNPSVICTWATSHFASSSLLSWALRDNPFCRESITNPHKCMYEHTFPSSFWKSSRYECSCTLYNCSRISVTVSVPFLSSCLQRMQYSFSWIHSHPNNLTVRHTSIITTAASFLDCTPKNHRFALGTTFHHLLLP